MASKKPLTAEVKAARASQQQATQLGIEQQMARTRSISRGAYGSRSLRSGSSGSSLAGYEIGKFKDDPGAVFGGGYVPPLYASYAPMAPTPKRTPTRTATPKKPTSKPPAKKKNTAKGQNIPQKPRGMTPV